MSTCGENFVVSGILDRAWSAGEMGGTAGECVKQCVKQCVKYCIKKLVKQCANQCVKECFVSLITMRPLGDHCVQAPNCVKGLLYLPGSRKYVRYLRSKGKRNLPVDHKLTIRYARPIMTKSSVPTVP